MCYLLILSVSHPSGSCNRYMCRFLKILLIFSSDISFRCCPANVSSHCASEVDDSGKRFCWKDESCKKIEEGMDCKRCNFEQIEKERCSRTNRWCRYA